jgi:hypothetical protein
MTRGSGPMPKHDEYKEIARAVLAHTAGVLTLAERWLRRADQLDYLVRRRLIPIPFGEGTRSVPHKEASIRRSGLSSDIYSSRNRAAPPCRVRHRAIHARPAR